jgi:hypothetical protein
MAASKRSGRAKVTIKILLCAAVAVASFVVVYPTGIYGWKQMLRLSRGQSNSMHGAWQPADGALTPPQIETPAVHRGTSNALDETSPPTEIGEYFRLYGERELSLLASDATNLNLEAAKHAGDWNDQGFLRMQETFKASLDLASAPAVPDFQVPAVQMPFQVPAVPTCCVAP